MTVLNEKPDGYFTQRNNEDERYSACNRTAMINAGYNCGQDVYGARKMGKEQPEDDLYEFGMADEACLLLGRRLNELAGTNLPIFLFFAVMALAFNRWIGNDSASQFYDAWGPSPRHYQDLVKDLGQGKNIVLGGDFMMYDAKGILSPHGHIVACNGVSLGVDYAVDNWNLLDPWGNYLKKYAGPGGEDGKNIPMPHSDFASILQGKDQAHKHVIVIEKGPLS